MVKIKFWYIYGRKFTKYLNGTWSLLNILMIFGIKEKAIILIHVMYCWLLLQIYLCYLWLLLCSKVSLTHTHTHIMLYCIVNKGVQDDFLHQLISHVYFEKSQVTFSIVTNLKKLLDISIIIILYKYSL